MELLESALPVVDNTYYECRLSIEYISKLQATVRTAELDTTTQPNSETASSVVEALSEIKQALRAHIIENWPSRAEPRWDFTEKHSSGKPYPAQRYF